ncbi:RidA family protein [Amorphus sp. 3PC139-8]|uniref:RidA family protein n=1 Tax=Amorphus sp. 3PC139-8 TaxID=2735676 RepID=UPI00345C67C7
MQILNPPTVAPPIQGLYAQLTIVDTGRIAFLAGQVALDRSGDLVGPGDHRLQAAQCFRNIKAALVALGVGPQAIAKMTIYVVDHKPERIEEIFGAGADVFGDAWPVTASTYLGVGSLGFPEWLVEIDAVIALG